MFLGDDDSISERAFSFSQFTSSFGKKTSNETSQAIPHSHSFQDILLTESNEQVKDVIMNDICHETDRRRNRAVSDSGSDDSIKSKINPIQTSPVAKREKNKRKPTMLLAGPKFRYHTTEPEYDLKRDTIYPMSVCIFENSVMLNFSFCF